METTQAALDSRSKASRVRVSQQPRMPPPKPGRREEGGSRLHSLKIYTERSLSNREGGKVDYGAWTLESTSLACRSREKRVDRNLYFSFSFSSDLKSGCDIGKRNGKLTRAICKYRNMYD